MYLLSTSVPNQQAQQKPPVPLQLARQLAATPLPLLPQVSLLRYLSIEALIRSCASCATGRQALASMQPPSQAPRNLIRVPRCQEALHETTWNSCETVSLHASTHGVLGSSGLFGLLLLRPTRGGRGFLIGQACTETSLSSLSILRSGAHGPAWLEARQTRR